MKKSIILVLFALITTASFAQISWNVKAGMNVSSWTSDGSKAKVGFKAGAGMEYAITEMWSIQPSLFFTTKGSKINSNLLEVNMNQMYLELPIMAAARFYVGDYTSIVVSAGPYVAYGIGGKTKTKLGDIPEVSVNTFGDYGAKRFDTGLGVGVAGEFGRIILGVEGQLGLIKVADVGNASPKNLNLSITLGYKF